MTFDNPKKWMSSLAFAEWWYNTNYCSSLEMTPFQTLYGFPPPQFTRVVLPDNPTEEVVDTIQKGN
jgi:hypothetical protein